MPQVPIIIPVIVLGILLGSLIKAGKKSIPKRRLLIASVVSGALNITQAYILTLVTPRTALTNSAANRAAQSTLGLAFFLESFLTGFLLVLVVMAVAAIYLRVRGRGEIETTEESETEEESKLTSG